MILLIVSPQFRVFISGHKTNLLGSIFFVVKTKPNISQKSVSFHVKMFLVKSSKHKLNRRFWSMLIV